MLNTISWQSYWTVIALLLALYYGILFLLFFKKDRRLLWGKASVPEKTIHASGLSAGSDAAVHAGPSVPWDGDPSTFEQPAPGTIEHTVYTCIDEITACLESAKRSKCIKEELLFSLQQILRKYPSINASEYQPSVANLIATQCAYLCSVHLSAEDVAKVWTGG